MSTAYIENIIGTYTRAYNRATALRDPRAEFYGRRLTQWIQILEAQGELDDSGCVFQACKTRSIGNVLQVA